VKTREEGSLELVGRAQGGDREAFEMLVKRHAAEIYRLGVRLWLTVIGAP
jgi:hypothetical protein